MNTKIVLSQDEILSYLEGKVSDLKFKLMSPNTDQYKPGYSHELAIELETYLKVLRYITEAPKWKK